MEYIDSYVDYFKSYNNNVEFLGKQMITETEYYEKTKEYSVNIYIFFFQMILINHQANIF